MEDLSEKEQIEQMRAWWSEYGNYVIGGIIVGIALIVGVNQFRSFNVNKQTEASVLFETVFEAVSDGDVDDAEAAATDIYENYPSTVYPSQARLAMARLYMDKGRDQDAADSLRAVVDAEPDSEMGLVARLRLAKILLYQDKPHEVVGLLADVEDTAFSARFSETLGDAYVELEQYEDAQEAYMRAMADSTMVPTVDRGLVQMKLDDLPDIVLADVQPIDASETPVAPAPDTADEATTDSVDASTEEEAE